MPRQRVAAADGARTIVRPRNGLWHIGIVPLTEAGGLGALKNQAPADPLARL